MRVCDGRGEGAGRGLAAEAERAVAPRPKWVGSSFVEITNRLTTPPPPPERRTPMPSPGIRYLSEVDTRGFRIAEVELDSLYPDESSNPRIEPQQGRTETILALLRKSPAHLFNLAKSIVDQGGLNPGELPHVSPFRDGWVVREGNRRIAAMQVLANPSIVNAAGVSNPVRQKWIALAASVEATSLPGTVRVVVGTSHDRWMELRHKGEQKGAGLTKWGPQENARWNSRRAQASFTLQVLSALERHDPEQFSTLAKPEGGFTTVERLLSIPELRDRVGVSARPDGTIEFRDGPRTIARLKQVLVDVSGKRGRRPLTSRRINKLEGGTAYLDEVEAKIGDAPKSGPVRVAGPPPVPPTKKARRPGNEWPTQRTPRMTTIQRELRAATDGNRPTTALVMLRVLVDVVARDHLVRHGLQEATKKDTELMEKLEQLIKFARSHGSAVDPQIVAAVAQASRASEVSLPIAVNKAIDDAAARSDLARREAEGMKRQLRDSTALDVLNDAVHRLENTPTQERVEDMLKIFLPVLRLLAAH
jgi:hypothetical protein